MMRCSRALFAAITLAVLAMFIARNESPSSLARSKITTQRSYRIGTGLDLAGMWRFALDPTDSGIKQQWFTRNLSRHDTIWARRGINATYRSRANG